MLVQQSKPDVLYGCISMIVLVVISVYLDPPPTSNLLRVINQSIKCNMAIYDLVADMDIATDCRGYGTFIMLLFPIVAPICPIMIIMRLIWNIVAFFYGLYCHLSSMC